jgi:hypothetical protein
MTSFFVCESFSDAAKFSADHRIDQVEGEAASRKRPLGQGEFFREFFSPQIFMN